MKRLKTIETIDKTGKEVLTTLQNLWKNEGKTIIMVTHDLNLAKYAERYIELKDGQVIGKKINTNMKR